MSVHQQSQLQRLPVLAEELVQAVPALDENEQRVAVTLYRLLAEGAPVPPSRVAELVGLTAERVRTLLNSWPGVYFDHGGSVIGFWGLALREMPHRLQVDGRTLYGWCAWDTLFIPLILGKEAHVESPCATTGETISLTVGPDGVRDVSPTGAVLSFLRPDGRFDHDIILGFCHYVLFFRSEEAGRQWTATHPNTFLLSLAEGFELGRLTWEAKFGATLTDHVEGSLMAGGSDALRRAFEAADISPARWGRQRMLRLSEPEQEFYRWILRSFAAGLAPSAEALRRRERAGP